MRLVYTPAAQKDLKSMPRDRAGLIDDGLAAIAVAPFGTHPQALPLKGEPDVFRLRSGDWRATYEIDRAADAVRVLRIRHRKEAYR